MFNFEKSLNQGITKMKKFTGLNLISFLFSTLLIFTLNTNTQSQVWQQMGTGTGGVVNAVTVYNNQLIAAGYFAVAGGQLVNNIARWTGSAWQPLGLGTNDSIFCLTIYNSNLVAGGRFTSAGGITCNKVAVWNGTSWSSTNGTINGNVLALAVSGAYLVAGGNFTIVNSRNMARIARYQTVWDTLGVGFNNTVNALAQYNNVLYAAGVFTISDGMPVNRIARLNGTTWTSVGTGMDDGIVNCLRVYNSSLYAGGTFTTIGGSTTNRIARWNGTSWSNVGFGFSGTVNALHSLGTNLYAGGEFDFADFLPANKIAVYNGTSWAALGSGIGGTSPKVKGISSFLGDIITGGSFTLAGGVSVNNIANWKLTVGITQTGNSVPAEYSLGQNYPNPFNPETKIRFDLPKNGFVTLSVFDSKGALVQNLVNNELTSGGYEVTMDASMLPSGVYFYKLNTDGFSATKKMILVK